MVPFQSDIIMSLELDRPYEQAPSPSPVNTDQDIVHMKVAYPFRPFQVLPAIEMI